MIDDHIYHMLSMAPDQKTFIAALQRMSARFGMEKINFIHAPSKITRSDDRTNLGHLAFSNLGDEFYQYYSENDLVQRDPIIAYAFKYPTACSWQDIIKNRGFQDNDKLFMQEAGDFGMAQGWTASIPSFDGSLTLLSLATSDKEERPVAALTFIQSAVKAADEWSKNMIQKQRNLGLLNSQ